MATDGSKISKSPTSWVVVDSN